MTGPNLVNFFNEFGRADIYGQGFPSRWIYTLDCLNELNELLESDNYMIKKIGRIFKVFELID